MEAYVKEIARVLEEFMKRNIVLGEDRVPAGALGVPEEVAGVMSKLGLLRFTNDGYAVLERPSVAARSLCHLGRHGALFPLIVGYEDVKELVCRSFSGTGVHVLFVGPPASGKTLFLESIYLLNKDRGVYVDMSNTTPAGLIELLHGAAPEVVCLDELDKPYDRRVYYTLSNILEGGSVVVTKHGKTFRFKFAGNFYGGANALNPIPEHIRDRFLKVYLRPYRPEEVREIALTVITKFGVIQDPALASELVDTCMQGGVSGIRDIIKLARLVRTREDLSLVRKILHRVRPRGVT